MQNNILLEKRALALIYALRQRIVDPGLCRRHRRRPEDFTRECRLTFPILVMLLLQKSLKSLQARLHEVVGQLAGAVGGEQPQRGGLHARPGQVGRQCLCRTQPTSGATAGLRSPTPSPGGAVAGASGAGHRQFGGAPA